jgi:hypothetical protein
MVRERVHSRHSTKSLVRLRDGGIEARGEVGDEDPLRAIEDALRTFGADEIVIWTGPNGIGRAAVQGARERFALPIIHLQSRAEAHELLPASSG